MGVSIYFTIILLPLLLLLLGRPLLLRRATRRKDVHDVTDAVRHGLLSHLQTVLHAPQRLLVSVDHDVFLCQHRQHAVLFAGQDVQQTGLLGLGGLYSAGKRVVTLLQAEDLCNYSLRQLFGFVLKGLLENGASDASAGIESEQIDLSHDTLQEISLLRYGKFILFGIHVLALMRLWEDIDPFLLLLTPPPSTLLLHFPYALFKPLYLLGHLDYLVDVLLLLTDKDMRLVHQLLFYLLLVLQDLTQDQVETVPLEFQVIQRSQLLFIRLLLPSQTLNTLLNPTTVLLPLRSALHLPQPQQSLPQTSLPPPPQIHYHLNSYHQLIHPQQQVLQVQSRRRLRHLVHLLLLQQQPPPTYHPRKTDNHVTQLREHTDHLVGVHQTEQEIGQQQHIGQLLQGQIDTFRQQQNHILNLLMPLLSSDLQPHRREVNQIEQCLRQVRQQQVVLLTHLLHDQHHVGVNMLLLEVLFSQGYLLDRRTTGLQLLRVAATASQLWGLCRRLVDYLQRLLWVGGFGGSTAQQHRVFVVWTVILQLGLNGEEGTCVTKSCMLASTEPQGLQTRRLMMEMESVKEEQLGTSQSSVRGSGNCRPQRQQGVDYIESIIINLFSNGGQFKGRHREREDWKPIDQHMELANYAVWENGVCRQIYCGSIGATGVSHFYRSVALTHAQQSNTSMQSVPQTITVSRYFNRTRFHSYINPSRLSGPLIMEFFPFLRVFYQKEPSKAVDRVEYAQISNLNLRPHNSPNNCQIYIKFDNKPPITLSFHCQDRKTAEYALTTLTSMCRFTHQSTLLHSLCALQNSVMKVLLQNPTFKYILKTTAAKFNQSFLEYRPLYQVYQRYRREIKEMADISYNQYSPLSKEETALRQERPNMMKLIGYVAGSNLSLSERGDRNERDETERQTKKVLYFYHQYRATNQPKTNTVVKRKTTYKTRSASLANQVPLHPLKPYTNNKADELNPSPPYDPSPHEQEINKLITGWMLTDKKWTKKKTPKINPKNDKQYPEPRPSETEKAQKLLTPKMTKEKLLQTLQLPVSAHNPIQIQSNPQNTNHANIHTDINENNQTAEVTHLKNAAILARLLYQMQNGKANKNLKTLSKVMAELTNLKTKTKSQQCISFVNKTLVNAQKYMRKPASPNKQPHSPAKEVTEIEED